MPKKKTAPARPKIKAAKLDFNFGANRKGGKKRTGRKGGGS